HGPALGSRLIRQYLVKAWGLVPAGVGCGRGEAVVVGLHKLAGAVLHLRVRHLVLLCVRVLDVADRAFDALNVSRNPFVALTTHPRRPRHRRTLAHATLPLVADLREIVSEHERGPRAIGPAHDRDGRPGQLHTRIKGGYGRVVPALDVAQKN